MVTPSCHAPPHPQVWSTVSHRGRKVAHNAATSGDVDVATPPVLKADPITLEGHERDVVALAWSPSLFLLSASVDCTVRLWHVLASTECLRVFR